MGVELFLEIGVEEIPSRFLVPAMADLRRLTEGKLGEAKLGYDDLYVTATPRRLVLQVDNLSEQQADETVEKLGPAWASAFDEAGNPSKQAIGFAKGQGVEPSDLIEIETDKGPRAGIRKHVPGRPAAEIVPALLGELISSIPWAKSMRWASYSERFVRPMRWLVALLDGKTVDLAFAGVKAGNETLGHRFHHPEAIKVGGLNDYLAKLKDAKVLVDYDARRAEIARQLQDAASRLSIKQVDDEALLDQVTGLVEWPVVLIGTIPEAYMGLPAEVIITPMRAHQKYFAFENSGGGLAPHFGVVSGLEAKEPSVVIAGNERVLNARLADAKFFYDEDLKMPLFERVEKLAGVVYHRKLGSYKDKLDRMTALSGWVADQLAPTQKSALERAVLLSKADLLTQMVGEFAELQGVMGREYATRQADPEPSDVADAIYEHYLPKSAGGELPKSELGALCSVVDKMDSLVSCLAVGLAPTGKGDPYALRRQALGIIEIVTNRQWRISLAEFVDAAIQAGLSVTKADPVAVREQTLEFFKVRLANWLRGQGIGGEIVDAVLEIGFDDLVETVSRAKAVHAFSQSGDYAAFAAAFKRVANITGRQEVGDVDPAVFQDESEKVLWDAFQSVREDVGALTADGRYQDALETITGIRPKVDAFFDNVMVMAEDERLRDNRLGLLANVKSLFSQIADFRRL